MDYKEYLKKLEIEKENNEKYLMEFKEYLKSKNLKSNTINKHIKNVEFYINEFLNYYDVSDMASGCYDLDEFLGDWFIRKCTWSNESSTKSYISSIKKFYQCMLELKHIDKEDYDYLCADIKENKEKWIDAVNDYNYKIFNDIF